MIRRGSRLSRALAVALAAAAVAAVALLIVRPGMALYDERERTIAARLELLTQYRQIAAGREALARTLSEAGQDPAPGTAYLPGDRDAVVAADLQRLAREIVSAAGGALQSTQSLPAQPSDGLQRVAVRLRLTASYPALYVILRRFDDNHPYLFVDALDIAVRPTRRNDPGRELLVEADMTVFGFMRVRPS